MEKENKLESFDDLEKNNYKELDLLVPENLALCSIALTNTLSEKISEDPDYMNNHNNNLDLVWRNIAVLDDRIESGVISHVSEENLLKLDKVKDQAKGLLRSYNKKINDGGPLYTMQSQFCDGGMPNSSSWLMPGLLKSATESFADIIIDSEIDESLIEYFANNIRPNIDLIDKV